MGTDVKSKGLSPRKAVENLIAEESVQKPFLSMMLPEGLSRFFEDNEAF
jgi:hypothetical protein